MGTVSRIFACLSITANIMSSMIVLLGLVSASSALVVPQQVLVTFHSQDELGGYEFGYSGGPSSRHEVKDHLGVVRGAWNLVDDGGLQSYKNISDGLGYRLLSGTHLPVAPVAPVHVQSSQLLPKPVQETAEVRAARETFEAAFRKAATLAKPQTEKSSSARAV